MARTKFTLACRKYLLEDVGDGDKGVQISGEAPSTRR